MAITNKELYKVITKGSVFSKIEKELSKTSCFHL